MIKRVEIIEKSRQITCDEFDLYVDGVLRKQSCTKPFFSLYMGEYDANNIIDIAESIYYNKVYVYTDIRNKSVDENITHLCSESKKVIPIYEIINKVCNVLDLTLKNETLSGYIIDYYGKEIGYYSIVGDIAYFYNNEKLITVIVEETITNMFIKVSSAITNLYNLENGSIS